MHEERIAFLIPASLDYVTALHGIWRAGGIANPEHQKIVRALCERLNIELLSVDEVLADEATALPKIAADRRAMILFTSGTTNKSKGVVITHNAIRAQITTLVDAWAWSENDVIPLFLPLHHIHGIINVLSCALWCGATVHLMPKLDIPKLSAEVGADDLRQAHRLSRPT